MQYNIFLYFIHETTLEYVLKGLLCRSIFLRRSIGGQNSPDVVSNPTYSYLGCFVSFNPDRPFISFVFMHLFIQFFAAFTAFC